MLAMQVMAGLPTSLVGVSHKMSYYQVRKILYDQGKESYLSEDELFFGPSTLCYDVTNLSLYGIEFNNRVEFMFSMTEENVEHVFIKSRYPIEQKKQAEQAFTTLVKNLDSKYKEYKHDIGYWNGTYDFSQDIGVDYADYTNNILLSASFNEETRSGRQYYDVELMLSFTYLTKPAHTLFVRYRKDNKKAFLVYHTQDEHNYEGLQDVEIPEATFIGIERYPIDEITEGAFRNCKTLRSVTIPASVRTIASDAFSGCDRLERINVSPDNPNYCSVDGVLFSKNQRRLVLYPPGRTSKSYAVPYGVGTIGTGAFSSHPYLESIVLPSSLWDIESIAFAQCPKLKYVTVKAFNPPKIRRDAFRDVKLERLLVPQYSMDEYEMKNWTYWGEAVESWAKLGEIDFYETERKKVGSLYYVLDVDEKRAVVTYEDIDSPDNYKGITSLGIPTNITVGGASYAVYGIAPEAFSGCRTIRSATIPSEIRYIGYSAFFGCPNLQTISIESSITEIGEGVVDYCESLTSINIPPGHITHYAENGILYSKDKKTLYQYAAGKTGASYTVPSYVKKVGTCAFNGCKNLQTIVLPATVTAVGDGLFLNCPNLMSVTCQAETPPALETDCEDCSVMMYSMRTPTLYVPAESIELYRKAKGWKVFRTILPISGL